MEVLSVVRCFVLAKPRGGVEKTFCDGKKLFVTTSAGRKYAIKAVRSRSSMDRMPPSEGGDAGSIPAESTTDYLTATLYLAAPSA